MTMAEYVLRSDVPHGKICLAFTPDEEIGRGADHFDVEGFAADFAYTVDGGAEGEIEYENFNACEAVFKIQGSTCIRAVPKASWSMQELSDVRSR